MTDRQTPGEELAPFVHSIFHPSDFSEAGRAAFAHALAIALAIGAERGVRFTILHATGTFGTRWQEFPAVRATLRQWGMLGPESPRSAVWDELSVQVEKVEAQKGDPVRASLEYLDERPTDLIVLATEGREGLPRWMHRSVAERLARKSRSMTLFVPMGARGFVSESDGAISLRRILLPVDRTPDPHGAMQYAARSAHLTGQPLEIVLLHVGDDTDLPALVPPDDELCTWRVLIKPGEDVVAEISRAADDCGADAIFMATQGHNGILDALRGSVTERVLRQARRPLLAVPAGKRPLNTVPEQKLNGTE